MVFQSKYYDIGAPPPPLFILSKYRIALLLFNASRKSTLSYGYMAISEAVTVGLWKKVFKSTSLRIK